jgi:hypothetical protein
MEISETELSSQQKRGYFARDALKSINLSLSAI